MKTFMEVVLVISTLCSLTLAFSVMTDERDQKIQEIISEGKKSYDTAESQINGTTDFASSILNDDWTRSRLIEMVSHTRVLGEKILGKLVAAVKDEESTHRVRKAAHRTINTINEVLDTAFKRYQDFTDTASSTKEQQDAIRDKLKQTRQENDEELEKLYSLIRQLR